MDLRQVILDTVCSRLEEAVASVERSGHEASRALLGSSRPAKWRLEDMKRVKGEMSRLGARLQAVADQLRAFLDDEGNMRELYLSRKARVRAAIAAEWSKVREMPEEEGAAVAAAAAAAADAGHGGQQPGAGAPPAAAAVPQRAMSVFSWGGGAPSLRLSRARKGMPALLLPSDLPGLQPDDERIDAEAREVFCRLCVTLATAALGPSSVRLRSNSLGEVEGCCVLVLCGAPD